MLLFLNTSHLNLNKYRKLHLHLTVLSSFGVCFDVSDPIPPLASGTIRKCAESCGKTLARARTPFRNLQ